MQLSAKQCIGVEQCNVMQWSREVQPSAVMFWSGVVQLRAMHRNREMQLSARP